MPDFQPTTFNAGAAPGLSAEEMNKLGTQYGVVKTELQKNDGTGAIKPHGSNLAITVDEAIADAYADTGTGNQVPSWFAKALKALKGTAHWYTDAAASIATIWGKFHPTNGHKHTGAPGDGPVLVPGFCLASIGTWQGGSLPTFERAGKLYRWGSDGTFLRLYERPSWVEAENPTPVWSYNTGSSSLKGVAYDAVMDKVVYCIDYGNDTLRIYGINAASGQSDGQGIHASYYHSSYPYYFRIARSGRYIINRSDYVPMTGGRLWDGSSWQDLDAGIATVTTYRANQMSGRLCYYSMTQATSGQIYHTDSTSPISVGSLDIGEIPLMFGSDYAVLYKDGYIGESALLVKPRPAPVIYMGSNVVLICGTKIYEISYAQLAAMPYYR